MVDTMDNITTLHPVNTLTVGEVISPTTSAYHYTVLSAKPKYPKGEGTYAVWLVLLAHKNSVTPFTVHYAVDRPEGWALEHGHYFSSLADALATYDKISG